MATQASYHHIINSDDYLIVKCISLCIFFHISIILKNKYKDPISLRFFFLLPFDLLVLFRLHTLFAPPLCPSRYEL